MEKSVLVFLFRWNCRSAEVQSPQYQFRTVVPAPNRRLGVAGLICFIAASSVLQRIDACAHGVHHPWRPGRLLRSVPTPWSGSHDEEPRNRTRPGGFADHGIACLRPET